MIRDYGWAMQNGPLVTRQQLITYTGLLIVDKGNHEIDSPL